MRSRSNVSKRVRDFYNPPISAVGGVITESGGYVIHTFAVSGTFTVLSGIGKIDYLLCGGGGGGGGAASVDDFYNGGGGGAGDFVEGSTAIRGYGEFPIVIGTGGAAVGEQTQGNAGNNTTALGLTAIGGGRGTYACTGGDGGSGGGAGGNRSAAYNGGVDTGICGYHGGNASGGGSGGGGGGGAGGNGGNSTSATGGTAGAAKASSISGGSVNYCKGGVGGTRSSNPANTEAGYGNGGNGAGYQWSKAGNDGVVIIRYLKGI